MESCPIFLRPVGAFETKYLTVDSELTIVERLAKGLAH